jgi:hypothetical protein
MSTRSWMLLSVIAIAVVIGVWWFVVDSRTESSAAAG